MFMNMLLVMWGFGSAFHVIFRRDQEDLRWANARTVPLPWPFCEVLGSPAGHVYRLLLNIGNLAAPQLGLLVQPPAGPQDYDTILHAFASMFEHQSELELKPMYGSKSPVGFWGGRVLAHT